MIGSQGDYTANVICNARVTGYCRGDMLCTFCPKRRLAKLATHGLLVGLTMGRSVVRAHEEPKPMSRYNAVRGGLMDCFMAA